MKAQLAKELKGKFWTVAEELIEELEAKGLAVDEYNEEYIEAYHEENEEAYTIDLMVAGNTITIQDIH